MISSAASPTVLSMTVNGISRVVETSAGKLPATIEWEMINGYLRANHISLK